MRKIYLLIVSFFLILMFSGCRSTSHLPAKGSAYGPKREFRGAWIQTVGQSRYRQMNSTEMKHYLTDMVKKLDEVGINVVIFQVRPEADAFYHSELEPWSRFLTGVQGKSPDDPTFDPLAFLIDACHKRGMELHAWLNPYRAQNNIGTSLASEHIYHRYPERFVQYGNQLFFDPGLPENRGFICEVVKDIVSRYEVDAIHMDDYFYPYPISGEQFPDDRSFGKYAASQGFTTSQRSDWRRNNVNLLIQQIKHTIAAEKPWVRFGISPFGIYRNKRNDINGSNTNGLQNYDDLFADVRLWVEKGWIDYNLPQLYWERGHAAADYSTLLQWWNDHNYGQHLYIGQDLKRSIDKRELSEKVRMTRELPHVLGNCYWYGYQILDNTQGVADSLRSVLHRNKALLPAYTHMHKGRPNRVKKLSEVFTKDMHFLTWEHQREPKQPEKAQKFAVYRFRREEKIDINRSANLLGVTPDNFFVLPYEGGSKRYKYVVTAIDAFGNESKVRKIKVAQ